MLKIETVSNTNVTVPNTQLGLNFFTHSSEFGIQNTIIIAGISKKKLNFVVSPLKQNLSLLITIGAKPFKPIIDFNISLALDTDKALKYTHVQFINKNVQIIAIALCILKLKFFQNL